MPNDRPRTIESPGVHSFSTEPSSSDSQRFPTPSRSLDDLPPILTIKQVTDLRSVDRSTIYAQIDRGKLRAFKIGNAYRIERGSLLAFIRADRPHSKRR